MRLNEYEHEERESPNVAKEYLEGLVEVVKNWNSLDPQAKKDALNYYGYTLAVTVGVPVAATLAFLSRMK